MVYERSRVRCRRDACAPSEGSANLSLVKLGKIGNFLPNWQNALLAVLSAILLILAFPDFEFWFLACFALVPLLLAIERQKHCVRACFILGWIFGNIFFFGTCWWLTYAPIHYAAFPPLLAYFLLFCVTSVAAIFPGLFAAIVPILIRRFGSWAFFAAPFVWVFTEFLRYWITGNNWNAIGYSQALLVETPFKELNYTIAANLLTSSAKIGGVLLTTFLVVLINSAFSIAICFKSFKAKSLPIVVILLTGIFGILVERAYHDWSDVIFWPRPSLIVIQPNVPMSGLNETKWNEHRRNHIRLAETTLAKFDEQQSISQKRPTAVIFPESPMNFMYEDDPETKAFINGFAAKNNVSVLFNSAEPDAPNGKFYNSAVMVSPEGKEVAQYDKIYLLPFGEAVPFPLEGILPGFVGNFSYGKEYDLLPVGDAKAGVMICFESHFGQLSREYVRNGADVIIEMTNDGYLGPTPVLRQHLANAVFRAVETNRPVLRVTNVGITAYINEHGQVLDAAEPYTEATRVWSVSKSDGSQTFYVKYGDWFAWLCSMVTVALLVFGIRRKPER
ncbi:MAG: apolipoprotein N-acyltransferase [Acidobacteria bacterium]|nr:MAG: apolipoprotein N-acyltransferase [Acidobacteriota bacterium]